MKAILITIFLIGASAYAEQIPVGCNVGTYTCYPGPNNQPECMWGYDMGKLEQIDLNRSGSGPNYEIYEGATAGKIRQTYDYRFAIYQRREANKSFNFLKIEIDVNGITIIANGENTAEARYFDASKKFGVGLHCTTDITPAP
jgi:hypothetical protein